MPPYQLVVYLTNSHFTPRYPTTRQKKRQTSWNECVLHRVQQEVLFRLVEDASAAVCSAVSRWSLPDLL